MQPRFHLRCKVKSILIGVLIAIPSGAGVALSILGGNAGSLVGVAISASLLPPAVNAVRSCAQYRMRLLNNLLEIFMNALNLRVPMFNPFV